MALTGRIFVGIPPSGGFQESSFKSRPNRFSMIFRIHFAKLVALSNGSVVWLVVSNIFYFHPYLGKIPILTNIFQRGWNHQPVVHVYIVASFSLHHSAYIPFDDHLCLFLWRWVCWLARWRTSYQRLANMAACHIPDRWITFKQMWILWRCFEQKVKGNMIFYTMYSTCIFFVNIADTYIFICVLCS